MAAARLFVALPAVAAAMLFAPQLAAATTFTVNTNDDADTVCTAAHCSLREAIKAANASLGNDQIVFDIPLGGAETIRPVGRSLPAVIDPVTLDATTQPGYSGSPIIELDGSLAGPGSVGFDIPAGQSVIEGFVVNGFAVGIRLAGADGTTIIGDYLGTDISGGLPRPNVFGIFVASADNTIGGTTSNKRNLISGNGDGVVLGNGATRNTILGNYIGTDATGTFALSNSIGVHVNNDVGGNIVGGNVSGDGNLISGNQTGISFDFAGSGNLVQGNLIGTDPTGLAAISITGQVGVLVTSSSGIVLGGPSTADRNVISGNASGGVYLQGPHNLVANNYVGVGADGQTPVGNTAGGLFVDASDNTVGVGLPGSQVEGGSNVIAYNGGQGGVVVRLGTQSSILGNSIHSNATLGIDLYPVGPTPNDPGDADTGPNDLQNSPVISSASTASGTVTVDGTLSSHPNTTYLLEFFANGACDPSGFGEGQEFLADRYVTTDLSGTATFSFSLGASHVGNAITSTATDPTGNTSEFSNCTLAAPIFAGSLTTLTPPNAVTPVGTTHTVTATVVGGTPEQQLAGITVYFTVAGSVNTTGQCTTDQTGQCSFTYQGPNQPGADLIRAYADANHNVTQDPSELSGTATKEWVLPQATAGQTTGGGQIAWVSGPVVFGFNAENVNGHLKGNCNLIDRASQLHIKCLSVTTLAISGTHATFAGEATVNGVATTYRIDVDDFGEPGTGRDSFKIQTGAGYTATGVLTAGNIQTRP
jgi:CSLREA domain-containing protein